MNKFHSVTLDVAKCVGCTACLKRCPTEAIRIRERRARIIDERCIDCGECIRVCEHHAKVATTNPLSAINRYPYKIALPAPALYGQFKNLQAAAAIPAASDTTDATHTAGRISNGRAAPNDARSAPIVAGMSWMDAVLITTNITIPSSAVPGFPEREAISFIAASPSGVAAFPNPSRFAARFIEIASCTGGSCAYFGNSLRSSGANRRASTSVRPPASAIFISPVHRQSIPVMEKTSSTALCAPEIAAADNSSIRPVSAAHKKLKPIIAAQI